MRCLGVLEPITSWSIYFGAFAVVWTLFCVCTERDDGEISGELRTADGVVSEIRSSVLVDKVSGKSVERDPAEIVPKATTGWMIVDATGDAVLWEFVEGVKYDIGVSAEPFGGRN